MVFVLFYVCWIISAPICYFLMPEFAPSLVGNSRIVYSIAAAWIIALIITIVFAYLKGYHFGMEYGSASDLTGKTVFANRFVKGSASGGKLTFHADCMEFLPHKANLNTDMAKFYYKDILRAEESPIINCLKLIFKDGHEEQLAMNHKREKIDFINQKVS